MILITGGLGFIGSNIINNINSKFVIIENLNISKKRLSYIKNKKKIIEILDWKKLNFNLLEKYNFRLCIHFGAISNTLENNFEFIKKNNILFSKKIFHYCEKKNIDFIYASSASVYGNGKYGYNDSIDLKKQEKLKPLNLYGKSKLAFDKFIIKKISKSKLKKIVGLRFFNVYGINEYHKHGQCSPIYKFYYEIKKNKQAILFSDFKKNNPIERDFIYISDVIKIVKKIIKFKKLKTILNIGTSKTTSFYEIARLVTLQLKKKEIILKDIPEEIKKNYQYKTKSNNSLLQSLKIIKSFITVENGVKRYLNQLNKNYINKF